MRNHPRNSPESAARIVALVLISDGHVCRSELEVLQALQVEHELGLAPGGFAQVVHTLCEDLLMGVRSRGSMMCSVEPDMLRAVLAEVDDPVLQAKVLRLACAAADADQHLADGEARLVAAAHLHWQLAAAARALPPAALAPAPQPV